MPVRAESDKIRGSRRGAGYRVHCVVPVAVVNVPTEGGGVVVGIDIDPAGYHA